MGEGREKMEELKEEEGEGACEVGDGRNDGKGEENVMFGRGGEPDDLRQKKEDS